jgi:hypothetical protein
LPVKEPKPVRAGNTKLCAFGKVEKDSSIHHKSLYA